MVFAQERFIGPNVRSGVITLDNVVDSYRLGDFGKAPVSVWLPEGREIVSDSPRKGSFAKRFAIGVKNHIPIYSSLKRNDKAIDIATKFVEKHSQNSTVSGTDVWEAMYKCGVNNTRTKKAFLDLTKKNYTIDGAIKSIHEIEHVGGIGGKLQRGLNKVLDYTGLSKAVGHLEIYQGENGWDTWNRNKRVSGETRAFFSGSLLAAGGAAMASLYAGGTTVAGLSDATQNSIYSDMFGYVLPIAFLGTAVATGDVLTGTRAAGMITNQYTSKKSKGDIKTTSGKVSSVLDPLLTFSLLGGMGAGCITTTHGANLDSHTASTDEYGIATGEYNMSTSELRPMPAATNETILASPELNMQASTVTSPELGISPSTVTSPDAAAPEYDFSNFGRAVATPLMNTAAAHGSLFYNIGESTWNGLKGFAHSFGIDSVIAEAWESAKAETAPVPVIEAEHVVSPFQKLADSTNEPLWAYLAKADTNPDGIVTGNEINDFLAGRKDAADLEARYNHLADFAAFDGEKGLSVKDTQAYMDDYYITHTHNFRNSQRTYHGIGDLGVVGVANNDGASLKFKFDFDETDQRTARVLENLRNDETIGYTPDEGDVVVRIFRRGDPTPIAIADMNLVGDGSYALSEDLILRDNTISEREIWNGLDSGNIIAEASLIDRQGTYPELGKMDCYNDDRVHIFDREGTWRGRAPPMGRVPVVHLPDPGFEPKPIMDGPVDSSTSGPTQFGIHNKLDGDRNLYDMIPTNRQIDRTSLNDVTGLMNEVGGRGFVEIDEWDRIYTPHENQTLRVYREGVDGVDVPEGYEDDQVVPVAVRPTIGNKLGINHRFKMVKHPGEYLGDTDGDGHLDFNDGRGRVMRKLWPVREAEIEGNESVLPRWHDTRGHRVRTGHDPNNLYLESERPGDIHDVDGVHVNISPEKEYVKGFMHGTAMGGAAGYGLTSTLAAPANGGTTASTPLMKGNQVGGPGIVGGQ